MKILGEGEPCERHSDAETAVRCSFPDSDGTHCHQCNAECPPAPAGLENCIRECSPVCSDAWSVAHPGYWIPIEDTLHGGRYDGIWENSGINLKFGEST